MNEAFALLRAQEQVANFRSNMVTMSFTESTTQTGSSWPSMLQYLDATQLHVETGIQSSFRTEEDDQKQWFERKTHSHIRLPQATFQVC